MVVTKSGMGTWGLGHGNWDMGTGTWELGHGTRGCGTQGCRTRGQNSFNAGGLETVKKPRGQLWRTFLVSNCVFFSIL